MSIPEVLESMDGAGGAARRVAVEEAEVRAALRAEVARAGSQDRLAREWGVSQHHLSRVLAGIRRPGPTIRDRLGVPHLMAARDASRKLDKLHVTRRSAARPARPPKEYPYPLRPLVLHIFAIEEELRRWAIESAPGQIRGLEGRAEAAIAGDGSSES
jgi:hypothetical protein